MTSGVLNLALIVVGFAGMEAVTYVVHRFVMHGPFESLHRSHHRNAAAAFADKRPEPNDVFPAAFSLVVIAALWVGFNVSGFAWLVPLFVGVTVYGIVYTAIHDGVIHGRVAWMKRIDTRWTRSLTLAHRAHHQANNEPYGMLLPSLTMRNRSLPAQDVRSGSRASHVPVDQ
ncbi:MAG: carotene hydroxylase [Actinomycetota bacterium]